jgi:hypothetical protein
MSHVDQPSFEDWNNLQIVADFAEEIVADMEPATNKLHGLLQGLPFSQGSISRLKWSLDGPTSLLGSVGPLYKLPKILPGIESIGTNRQERIDCLRQRLLELKAFQWINSEEGFSAVISTLNRIAKTDDMFAKDTRFFLLLRSISTPLSLLLFERKNNLPDTYPTLNEVKAANIQAQKLLSFLDTKGAIYGVVDVPVFMRTALINFTQSLGAINRSYRKPRDDGTLRERVFRDRVIRNIDAHFGKCSPTLISKVLDLVDYEHDESDLKKHIKDLLQESKRKALVRALRRG